MRAHHKSAGFTLIELMIAMVLLGILAGIAVPAFDTMTLESRLRAYANDFAAAARLARSEAVKRNSTVRLCMTADGVTCTTSGSWEQGWLVTTASNEVVRAWPAVREGYHIISAATALAFQANGLGPGMTAVVCRESPSVGEKDRLVTISTLGRTDVEPRTSTSCL